MLVAEDDPIGLRDLRLQKVELYQSLLSIEKQPGFTSSVEPINKAQSVHNVFESDKEIANRHEMGPFTARHPSVPHTLVRNITDQSS